MPPIFGSRSESRICGPTLHQYGSILALDQPSQHIDRCHYACVAPPHTLGTSNVKERSSCFDFHICYWKHVFHAPICAAFVFLTLCRGIVTSVIRFSVFFNVKALATDGTYVSADLAVWSLVEPGMYLLAACLPTIRPLLLKVFGGDQR